MTSSNTYCASGYRWRRGIMFHVEQLKGQSMSKQEHTPFQEALMRAYVRGWSNGHMTDEGKVLVAKDIADQFASLNNHDALVDALQGLVRCMKGEARRSSQYWLTVARKALADVEASK